MHEKFLSFSLSLPSHPLTKEQTHYLSEVQALPCSLHAHPRRLESCSCTFCSTYTVFSKRYCWVVVDVNLLYIAGRDSPLTLVTDSCTASRRTHTLATVMYSLVANIHGPSACPCMSMQPFFSETVHAGRGNRT